MLPHTGGSAVKNSVGLAGGLFRERTPSRLVGIVLFVVAGLACLTWLLQGR